MSQQDTLKKVETLPANIGDSEDIIITGPTFKITGDHTSDIKTIAGENYIDKSMDINSDKVLESVNEVYDEY